MLFHVMSTIAPLTLAALNSNVAQYCALIHLFTATNKHANKCMCALVDPGSPEGEVVVVLHMKHAQNFRSHAHFGTKPR